MLEWVLRLVGIGDEFLVSLDEVRLGFQWPAVLWVAVLLPPLTVWMYLRQRRSPAASPALCGVLTGIRLAILTILVLVLAGPLLELRHQSERKPVVALLFDHSQSMQLPTGLFPREEETLTTARAAGYVAVDDATRGRLAQLSRAKLAHAVVQHARATFLEPLSKRYELQFHSFSRDSLPLAIDPGTLSLSDPSSPGGPATHIGDALARAVEQAGGRAIAGVILFSDGQNTGGRSPLEAARTVQAGGVPIFAVPCGSATRLHDVSVADVFTSGMVFAGDTARVAVTVDSHGFDGRPVKVEVREGSRLLDARDLVLRGAEQQQVELSFTTAEPGAHLLTVQVSAPADELELLRANNTAATVLEVTNEKLRVLHVDGPARWDYRFLRNALRRDRGIMGRSGPEPDSVLETEWRRLAPAAQALALPHRSDQLAEYHTVILGDASPRLLDPEFIAALAKAVRDQGVGLIVAAGQLAMPHAHEETLRQLLPVRLAPGRVGVEPTDEKPFRIELSPEGALHETTRFFDDAGRNQRAWAELPGCWWCSACVRPAPAASVLAWVTQPLEQSTRVPLLAYHHAGAGKVLFVGTDATWQWRQGVGERCFARFWGQAIRFVARRDRPPVETRQPDLRSDHDELRRPNVDRIALEQLARVSSGELVELSRLDTIPNRLKGEPYRIQLHRQAALWDNWLTLVALLSLYALDVFIRRWRGLS